MEQALGGGGVLCLSHHTHRYLTRVSDCPTSPAFTGQATHIVPPSSIVEQAIVSVLTRYVAAVRSTCFRGVEGSFEKGWPLPSSSNVSKCTVPIINMSIPQMVPFKTHLDLSGLWLLCCCSSSQDRLSLPQRTIPSSKHQCRLTDAATPAYTPS